jgi:hypothetical protein
MVKGLDSSGKANKTGKPFSLLRRQLRSDRQEIQSFYSSHLRHRGATFESGDGMFRTIPYLMKQLGDD